MFRKFRCYPLLQCSNPSLKDKLRGTEGKVRRKKIKSLQVYQMVGKLVFIYDSHRRKLKSHITLLLHDHEG